ncbi:hypothetical protein F5Y16DRAFT_401474 [Xylariaceae sp. FL0255]|nr:hypothetical protein F5Y16DRAFT_401474 [Xylariaceae sp. FL0255]
MKFTAISALALALLATSVQGCAKGGDVCQVQGNKACGCGTGHLFKCEKKSGGGLHWVDLGNCPANPGGLQCVNGHCVK